MRAVGEELLVLEPLLQDVAQHRVQERDIGARQHLQVDLGAGRELDPPRVGHDELRTAPERPLDRCAEHRVALGGVRTEHEDHV